MGSCCHDCLCKEGELHNYFPRCDMERCPLCKRPLLSCGCDTSKITQKMREPYFEYDTWFCNRCRKKDFPMKMISEEEWKSICGSTYPMSCILCSKCMDFIEKCRSKL